MKKYATFLVLLLFIGIDLTLYAQPEPTTVVVRTRAKDAKFIGSSMGGALVIIRNVETGEILAKGFTRGSTGDTGRLMNTPQKRYMQLSTPGASKFETEIMLDEPTFVQVEATAPYVQAQSHTTVTTRQWLIPGKDITGDGIMLEIPGFAVDVLSPQAHEVTNEDTITIRANIVMMCGCPTSPGGLWDSSEYEIKALVKQGGTQVASVPLSFTGKTSTYEGTFNPAEGGAYEITVYAFHPKTGNAGVDRSSVIVSR